MPEMGTRAISGREGIIVMLIIVAIAAIYWGKCDRDSDSDSDGDSDRNCDYRRHHCHGGYERFGWANWTENSERENFARASPVELLPPSGRETYRQSWHRRHGGRR
jgi:hypothetical protein